MKGSITRRGKASWRLKFDVPGTDGERKTQYETVRGAKGKAQLRLAEILTSIGKGRFVEQSRLTVAEHVAARIDHWSASGAITARTTKRYEVLLKKQIAPHLGKIVLQRLTTTDVEGWHAKLKVAGLAHGTIRSAHRVIGKALNDALRHDQLTRNVCTLQRVPKTAPEEASIISADEIKTVVSRLKGKAIYPRAMVALFCGLRAGEILALRWSSVDLDKRLLHVREATEEIMGQPVTIKAPKTKAGRRTLTVPDVAIEALREHRRQTLEERFAMGAGKLPDDALVFPARNGGPAGTADLSKSWRRTVEALGLPAVNFHGLRHSHASQLIDAKLDLATISKRLGHANPGVTLRTYAHRFKTDDAAAADIINAALGANSVPKSG
jgi:integrase